MTKTFKVMLALWVGIILGYVGMFFNTGLAWVLFLTGSIGAMWAQGVLDD